MRFLFFSEQELNRRQSLLCWEDGEGVSSPAEAPSPAGDVHRDGEIGEEDEDVSRMAG